MEIGEIKELNRTGLEKIKAEMDEKLRIVNSKLEIIEKNRLDVVKRKDSVKNKTKLCQLTENDIMFHVCFTPWTGICTIENCNFEGFGDEESEYGYHNIRVGGSSMGIHKDQINNHFFASYHCSHVNFYTLKPETWEEDFQKTLDYKIKQEKGKYHTEIGKLKKSVKAVIKDGDKINDYIKNEL